MRSHATRLISAPCPRDAVSVDLQAKEVTVQTQGHDKYKRSIGDVILPDGTIVNQKLVKQGWWYRKYAPENTTPKWLETKAREVREAR